MKILKITYTRKGKRTQSDKWYASWKDSSGRLRRLALFPDRKPSQEAAGKIAKLESIRASGDMIPPELSRFIEGTTPYIRAKLAEFGVLPASAITASKPLPAHITDWGAALRDKGTSDAQADLVTTRVTRIFTLCGFVTWQDISASRLQACIGDLHKDTADKRGISIQTANFYLNACKQFGRWMVKDRRAHESAIGHLDGQNVKLDRRHDRRALSAEELCRLLEAAAAAPVRFGMTGTERACLYRLAVETGLRAGELRSLTAGSFHLDGDSPTVTIAAAYAKNRREDTLPLRKVTADALRPFITSKMPAVEVFTMPTYPGSTATMFRADLADARKTWLDACHTTQEREQASASTFLLPVDGAGRHADFHSLRHTFISNLAAGGVHPKTAQTLARHSTITLTMDRYTHVRAADCADALDVLPNLPDPLSMPQQALATGTEGQSVQVEVSGIGGGIQTGSEATVATAEQTETPVFTGVSLKATFGTRTRNIRFTKPVLYQLS